VNNFQTLKNCKMKFILSLFLVFASLSGLQAQHKIVFDITGSDTTIQSALFRQIKNVLTLAPDAKIEVVYHGQAITGLVQGQSFFAEKVKELREASGSHEEDRIDTSKTIGKEQEDGIGE
jgi:hypothetical protein